MKHIYLFIFTCITVIAFAQPVINSNVIAPLGTRSVYLEPRPNVVNGFLPGAAGDSVLWDFATMDTIASTTFPQYTVRADTSFYYSDFPGSNRAIGIYEPPGPAYAYTYVDSTKYEYYGLADLSKSVSYVNPHKLLVFPFTYNDEFIDTFYTADSAIYGSVHVKADAYGTLILLGATYNNVLRVATREVYRYNIATNPNDSVFYEVLYHRWYQPNTPDVLLESNVSKRITNVNGVPQETILSSALYITTNPFATSVIEYAGFASTVFPNPAADWLVINAETDIKHAELVDLCGKTVMQQSFYTRSGRLNLGGIGAGTYLLKILTVDNRSKTIRVIHY